MAQDRANPPPIPKKPVPPPPPSSGTTLPVDGKAQHSAPPPPVIVSNTAPVDAIRASIGGAWDLEDDVRTLKQAASTRPLGELVSVKTDPALAHAPTLRMPVPSELIAPGVTPPAPPSLPAGSLPPPSIPGGSLPPPSLGSLPPAPLSSPLSSGSIPPPPGSATEIMPAPNAPSRPPPLPSRPPPKVPPLPRKGPPPLQRADAQSVRPPRAADALSLGALLELLNARAATLAGSDDTVGKARVHVELAIVAEVVLGDDGRAAQHAESALRVDPTHVAAHALLRRRKYGRGPQLPLALGHLDREIVAAVSEQAAADLFVEKARLLELAGDAPELARAAWEQALARNPEHMAALRGLEAHLWERALAGDQGAWEALAPHLARLADAMSDASLAAWLHVERARVLELRLGQIDAARGAYERALQLEARVGPVREAVTQHLSAHNDTLALSLVLEHEAELETDPVRAARLDLEAATIARLGLGDVARATSLLQRAASLAPTTPLVDRLVLDGLVELHEAAGDLPKAIAARRARLRFFQDGPGQAHELRVLSHLVESQGDPEGAVVDLSRAHAVAPHDVTFVEELDRLYTMLGRHEERIQLWVTEAARTEDGPKRARALARAANVADQELGRAPDAVRHLRAAWVAAPGDTEIVDALARLLSPMRAEETATEHRSLVELYTQAAEAARDRDRRVAYLEKVAVLWEEVLDSPARALAIYQEILSLEPDRRGAIVGLGRCAAKTEDSRLLAKALLDEARLAEDGGIVLSLKTRAAGTLAKVDPSRAIALVHDVLEHDPAHAAARTLETRLHQDAGRWELAGQSLRARIDMASTPDEKVELWLALADLQSTRLRAPREALVSLQAARALDPRHPVPAERIVQLLAAIRDDAGLRTALEGLATTALGPEERVRYLVMAAQIDDLVLGDAQGAARLYARAYAEMPDEELLADRLARVVVRRPSGAPVSRGSGATATLGNLTALLSKRLERATAPEASVDLAFQLASTLVETGIDTPRAATLLESVLQQEPRHVAALRTLEHLARRQGDLAVLGRTLSRQGESFVDGRARLGSLTVLAFLEEWKLPTSDPLATADRILSLDPTNGGALETVLRKQHAASRRGDVQARHALVTALRTMRDQNADPPLRLAFDLRLGLMLEATGDGESGAEPFLREALGRYREALRVDNLSVTAATGLARLAGRFAAPEATVAAAEALAELTTDHKARARYLLDGADVLLTADTTDGMGSREMRRHRAARFLEKALDADPNSIPAAGRLSTLLLEEGESSRLLDIFRAAIRRAQAKDAVVMIGSEIARVAREELHDLGGAIEAMRKVREAAPQHVPSLLTLAELCIEQRAWPDAVDALESVVATSHDPGPRLTALFALASIYDRVLHRPADTERVLRAALALDPSHARALKGLLRFLASPESGASSTAEGQREMANLLARLTDVEKDQEQRSLLLLELSELRLALGERGEAEWALWEAVAANPKNGRAASQLRAFYQSSMGLDVVAYARALAQVIDRGAALGHEHARWYASLGQLEVERLSRLREGVAHLAKAIQLDPSLVEIKVELAAAHMRGSSSDDAARLLLTMLLPTSSPFVALKDPGSALGLLERALSAERRPEEALVTSELRAIAGDLDDGRHAWLRARRLGPFEAHHQPLDRPTLVTQVLPPEGRHVLLEVGAALAGIEGKIFRVDLAEMGVSSRDRVSLRSGQTTRLLLERVARSLGVGEVELVISPQTNRTRVLAQDVPWVVVPQSLAEAPEPLQLAALARAVARIAFGAPWLEELPPAHIEAFLVAAARQVVPGYGADTLDVLAGKLVSQYEAAVARALGRRQRKLLDELAPHIAAPKGAPPPLEPFLLALRRGEVRAGYLVTGDLLAAIDELRLQDPTLHRATASPGRLAVATVLEHPFAGDLCRFALMQDAVQLRRKLGTAWTG